MRNALSLIAAAVLVATSAAAAERSGFYIGGDLGESDFGVSQGDANDFANAIADQIDLFTNIDATSTKGKLEDTDFTYSLFIGYQFLPWLAAEGTWMDLGKASVKAKGTYNYLYVTPPGPGPLDPRTGTYSSTAEFKSDGWAVSLLPMIPIGETWNIFGRLGWYWGNNDLDVRASAQDFNVLGTATDSYSAHSSSSDNNDAFLWGLGASWTWDQRVTVRFEFQQAVDLLDVEGTDSSVDRYTVGLIYRFGHEEEAAPMAAAPVAAAPVVAAAPAKCKDSDNDGVCDTADKCPNTPAGDRVGPNGCSCDVTVRTHFAFDSAELTAEDKAALDKAAARLKELQFVEGVANGHTDNVGDPAYNMKLSERRAQAVVDYLAAQGVASGRIKAVGYGDTKPLADNSTEEGRAQNRRVTIRRTDCGPAK